MFTEQDEKIGLVRTEWKNIRDRVGSVSPVFAKLIDSLSPGKDFPLYLAYYPFGELKGDTSSPFLPQITGGNRRLTDPNLPKEISQELGYGRTSSPLGMLLEKRLEYYIDIPKMKVTIPWQIFEPGAFFPLARFIQNTSNRIYTPNGLLTAVSGSRSIFMLPSIGCASNHAMLMRHYNISPQPPKSPYDHWHLFKDIINHSNHDWRSCVLYFSDKWVDKIQNDNAWYPVKKYLLEMAWNSFEFERNHIYYNIAYSLIQNDRNLKPNPYLSDTASHLFTIALGGVPGYSPACNDDSMPIKLIQDAFYHSYGLKKYIPTIMHPVHFLYENPSSRPVYYSLRYPSTFTFSPKSRKISSTLFDMRELKHIVNTFKSELVQDSNIFSDTVITEIAKNVDFSFFHNEVDPHGMISDSSTLEQYDDRFLQSRGSNPTAAFARDGSFLRGCIGIKRI